jgi:hypothetical protein
MESNKANLIKAVSESDIQQINETVALMRTKTQNVFPWLYLELIDLPFEQLSDEILAIYAGLEPPQHDLLLDDELDSENELGRDRIYTTYQLHILIYKLYKLFQTNKKRTGLVSIAPINVDDSKNGHTLGAFLAHLIIDRPILPKNITEIVLKTIWDNEGQIENLDILESAYTTKQHMIYFLTCFEKQLKYATESLEQILSQSTHQQLLLDPGFISVLLSKHPEWIVKYQGRSISSYIAALWATKMEKTSRIATSWILNDKLVESWTMEERLRLLWNINDSLTEFKYHLLIRILDSLKLSDKLISILTTNLDNTSIGTAIGHYLYDKTENLIYIDFARTVFKTLPAKSLDVIAKQKLFPKLVMDGIYTRNFLLDDKYIYVIEAEPKPTYKELNDMCVRWNGSPRVISGIVNIAEKEHQEIPYTLIPGLRFNNKAMIDFGLKYIFDFDGIINFQIDDLLLKTTRETWNYLIQKLNNNIHAETTRNWLAKHNLYL